MANATAGRGACLEPFLDLSLFPDTGGYVSGRFCAPVPSLQGTINCCLPCPITDWVYSDDFSTVNQTSQWLNVAGMVASLTLLLSFLVLPVKNTSRHYLTVGLVAVTCLMQLGFIIPLGANPQQCHDAITPNDMHSDLTCAFSSSFLLFGGFGAIIWCFLRSVSIHLQICWQAVPGPKFFWSSLVAGVALPGLFLALSLPLTGTSYRFGNTCHINHDKALEDFWGPLLAFAAISALLQFVTFGYCIKVYLKALFDDSPGNSTTQASSTGAFSSSHAASRAASIKTMTARQAYRRIRKVIALQWRGTAIVLIIIINVVFLAIVFVQMDNTVTSAMKDFSRAQPWLFCLAINNGDKNKCLSEVQQAKLVLNEPTVMAVLILLSLNGLWAFFLLGRVTMITGWIEFIRNFFRRRSTDFVSVDAKRMSTDPRHYEMILSPPSRPQSFPQEPDNVFIAGKPAFAFDEEEKLGLATIPQSPASRYSDDYFMLKGEQASRPTTAGAAPSERSAQYPYSSPKLSFSTPRPPSAVGRTNSQTISIYNPQRRSHSLNYHSSQPANRIEDGRPGPLSSHALSTTTIDTNTSTINPSNIKSAPNERQMFPDTDSEDEGTEILTEDEEEDAESPTIPNGPRSLSRSRSQTATATTSVITALASAASNGARNPADELSSSSGSDSSSTLRNMNKRLSPQLITIKRSPSSSISAIANANAISPSEPSPLSLNNRTASPAIRSNQHTPSRTRPARGPYDWDSQSTHAKPSR